MKFVPFDGDCCCPFVAAHDAAANDELQSATVVKQGWPRHRKFNGHARGKHAVRGKPNSSAGNIECTSRAGFGDPVTIQHSVAHVQFDLETAPHSSLMLDVGP